MGSLAVSNFDNKVIFVMGATGTGKSKLAIALATYFGGEIVNSDKMQVYDGLNIITNKITEEELTAIPHHLLGGVHPDADYDPYQFRNEAMLAIESIRGRGRLPIIAGGSNRYIEELVEGEGGAFRAKYECCFLWLDVEWSVLHEFVAERVDKMVEEGLVEEARRLFDPHADYTRGVRRAIGVREMEGYFRAKAAGVEEEELERLLEAAIREIKWNTCKLTFRQVGKIRRLWDEVGWDVKRIDATKVFCRMEAAAKEELWEKAVKRPAIEIVERFLDINEREEIEYAAAATNIYLNLHDHPRSCHGTERCRISRKEV